MKKIILILLAIAIPFHFSSVAFALSDDEMDELMNRAVESQMKIQPCYNKATYARDTFKMKESGMSESSICYRLKQDYKMGTDNCRTIIGFIDNIRSDYSSMTADELYYGLRDLCEKKQN